MKQFYLIANILLVAFFTNAQKPFVPHVVFDDNNKVYAVKATPALFLKFIDSTGEFLVKNITNGKDFFGRGHAARVVPSGQETKFPTKAEAQALLDYWNQLQLLRVQSKKKPSHYND